MVVTGDLSQVDLPRGVFSGLFEASRILRGVHGVGVVELEALDVIRHDVVARIVEAYDREERRRRKTKETSVAKAGEKKASRGEEAFREEKGEADA